MAPPSSQPAASRLFDYCVVAVGLALALAATVSFVASPTPLRWEMWLVAPLLAMLLRYPMTLFARSASVQISFDSLVIAFLGILLGLAPAMVIYSAGMLLSMLTTRVRWTARVFNLGCGLVSGAVGLWVLETLQRPGDDVSPRELVAVAAGCGAAFVVDYVLSEISVALEEGVSVSFSPWSPDMAVPLLGVGTVASVGYLGAVMERHLPPWCMALLAVPVGALLVAAVARDASIESQRRMRVLFTASRRIHAAQSPEEVVAQVDAALHDLARGPSYVQLRDTPPGPDEVGAPFDDGDTRRWLVTSGLWRSQPSRASDYDHLGSLGRMGSDALTGLRMRATVTRLAERDALTGLCNRAVFVRMVDEALARCRGSRRRVAVLFCDLDGFKTVNDWFGHSAGDELLVDVTRSLELILGPQALLARLGGDEFAALLQDLPDDVDLTATTTAVLTGVERRFESQGRFAMVSTSLGWAASDGRHTAAQLIRNADIAMYHAKYDGKNRAEEYHPALGRARVRTLALAEALSRAVEARALTVVYQPVLSAAGGHITGFEALARWEHEGRAIPPDVFIPLAENRGLIEPLGELILDLVARDAARLSAAAAWPLVIGVNVSAVQLSSRSFVAAVRRARMRVRPLELNLEITERQVVGDDVAVGRALEALHADGVRLSLDDFGVGYSSIGYLQRLSVSALKIDRVFCVDVDVDQRRRQLLCSMIAMGQAMRLDVVVEGVERQAQLDALLSCLSEGVEHVYLQGNLLGLPMPLDQTVRLLTRSLPTVSPVSG